MKTKSSISNNKYRAHCKMRKRPKTGQMRQRQQRYGLTQQQERTDIANARPVTRSMGMMKPSLN